MVGKFYQVSRNGTSTRGKPVFVAAVSLLLLAFLMGGSSRPDVASLVIFRPLSVLFLGFAVYHLRLKDLSRYRFPLLILAGCYVLVLLHLIPLPPMVWQNLGGRELVREIGLVAGQADIWRPLSLVPKATRNAFWALIPTTAFLLLLIQLNRSDLRKFVLVLSILGIASALVGLLQLLGDPKGPLYLYASTNNGDPVGLFANRNHHAILLACVIPVLFVYGQGSSKRRGTRWLPDAAKLFALAGLAILIPLILIAGSRAGLAVAALALVAGPFVAAPSSEPRVPASKQSALMVWLSTNSRFILGAAAALFMFIAILLGRDQSVDRLANTFSMEELRLRILPTMWEMIKLYAPFGSGIGTFQWVYQVNEPDALLSPGYMNRAHNEWLDILLTSGAAGAVLATIAVAGIVRRGWHACMAHHYGEQSRGLSRAGAVILIILASSTITDYHIRVPSIAMVAILALVWLYHAREANEGNTGKESLHH